MTASGARPALSPRGGPSPVAIVALFVLSGAAGLIYEVVWARQLVLVFGNTSQAVSAILTGFFGGMAIGSVLGGRLADRVRSPLRLYGLLELVLVVVVVLTPITFTLIREVYRGFYGALETAPGGARPGAVRALAARPWSGHDPDGRHAPCADARADAAAGAPQPGVRLALRREHGRRDPRDPRRGPRPDRAVRPVGRAAGRGGLFGNGGHRRTRARSSPATHRRTRPTARSASARSSPPLSARGPSIGPARAGGRVRRGPRLARLPGALDPPARGRLGQLDLRLHADPGGLPGGHRPRRHPVHAGPAAPARPGRVPRRDARPRRAARDRRARARDLTSRRDRPEPPARRARHPVGVGAARRAADDDRDGPELPSRLRAAPRRPRAGGHRDRATPRGEHVRGDHRFVRRAVLRGAGHWLARGRPPACIHQSRRGGRARGRRRDRRPGCPDRRRDGRQPWRWRS